MNKVPLDEFGTDETAKAVRDLIEKYDLEQSQCTSIAQDEFAKVNAQDLSVNFIGMCPDIVAEGHGAEAVSAASDATAVPGPSEASAKAERRKPSKYEEELLAIDAGRTDTTKSQSVAGLVAVKYKGSSKYVTFDSAIQGVRGKDVDWTKVDNVADGGELDLTSDVDMFDETASELGADETGDEEEPVGVDTDAAHERLPKSVQQRTSQYPYVEEPRPDLSHAALQHAPPKEYTDITLDDEHIELLLLLDASGDVPQHIRRRLMVKNFDQARLDSCRYVAIRFTKPSFIRADHTIDAEEFLKWIDKHTTPKPEQKLTREEKRLALLRLLRKRSGYNIPIEYQKHSFSAMTYIKMGRGNRHGYDPYMYAMILWHWNLVDRRCDHDDTCEPCVDGGTSVKTRWTKNLDWTFERLQSGRIKEVLNRIHKPSHHLPATITHQAGANIRRYLWLRAEYCREQEFPSAEYYTVPKTREKALEMIAVVDRRNKRIKARPRRAPVKTPKSETVAQEQTPLDSAQLPEVSGDLAERLSQTSVADTAQNVLDTEDEPDFRAEMVPADARQQSMLDNFVDQHMSPETLQTMQMPTTGGNSQPRSASGAQTPTRVRSTRVRYNKPENVDIKSCNTPQLGVAKTTAPDTRGFSKVGPILVQSPSQTRATRTDRSRRRDREEAANAQPDDNMSLPSVAALTRAPLRPSELRGRKIEAHADQTWQERSLNKSGTSSALDEAVVGPITAASTASHVGRNSSPTDLQDIAKTLSAAQSPTIAAALAEEAARLEQSRSAGPTPNTVDAMARAIQGVAVGAAKHIKETTPVPAGFARAKTPANVNLRLVSTDQTGQTSDVLMNAALTIGESPECDQATIVVSGRAATSPTLLKQIAELGADLHADRLARPDSTPATAQQRSAAPVDQYAHVNVRQAFNDTMSTEEYEHGIPTSLEKRVLTTDDEHDDVDEHYATASEGAERADDDVQALEQPMDTSEAPAVNVSTLPDVVTPTTVADQVLRSTQALPTAVATGDTPVAPPVAPSPVETPGPTQNRAATADSAKADKQASPGETAKAGPSGDATDAPRTTTVQKECAKTGQLIDDDLEIVAVGALGDQAHPFTVPSSDEDVGLSTADEEELTRAAEEAEAEEASRADAAKQTATQEDVKPKLKLALPKLTSTLDKMARKIKQYKKLKQEPGVKLEPLPATAQADASQTLVPKTETPSTSAETAQAVETEATADTAQTEAAADAEQAEVAADTAQTDVPNVRLAPIGAEAEAEPTTSAPADNNQTEVADPVEPTTTEVEATPPVGDADARESVNDLVDAQTTQILPRLPDEQELDVSRRADIDLNDVVAGVGIAQSVDDIGLRLRRRRQSETDDAASASDDLDLCADPDKVPEPVTASTPCEREAPQVNEPDGEQEDSGSDIDEDAILNDTVSHESMVMAMTDDEQHDGLSDDDHREADTDTAQCANKTAQDEPVDAPVVSLPSDTPVQANVQVAAPTTAQPELQTPAPVTPAKTQKRSAAEEADDVQAKRDKPSTSHVDERVDEAQQGLFFNIASITLVRVDPANAEEQMGPQVTLGPSLGVFRVHATFDTPPAQQPIARE